MTSIVFSTLIPWSEALIFALALFFVKGLLSNKFEPVPIPVIKPFDFESLLVSTILGSTETQFACAVTSACELSS